MEKPFTENQIIYMQDKIFPQWKKYWIRKSGHFVKRENTKDISPV